MVLKLAFLFFDFRRISVYIASVKNFGSGGNSENFGDMNPKDSRAEGNGGEAINNKTNANTTAKLPTNP